VLLLYRTSRPRVAELGKVPGTRRQYAEIEQHPENEVPPGIVIVGVESGLSFANSDWVRRHLRDAASRPGIKAIVLDAASVAFLDVTAAEMLSQAAEDLHARGVELLVARDIGEVRDVLRDTGDEHELALVYRTVQAAVDAAQRKIGTPARDAGG
jgi:sulfate permease, SulP family